MKSGETFAERIARKKREIADFAKDHPEEFRQIVDDFEAWAAEGAPAGKAYPDQVYAALLADWLHAKAAGINRDLFIDQTAARGWRWSDRRGRPHVWNSTAAIRRALDKAQATAKRRPEFRRMVDEWLNAYIVLRPHNRRKK